MDANDFQMGFTLLLFVAVIGIGAWVWSRRQAARLNEAAKLPLVVEEVAVADGYPHRHGYRAKRPP